jgi:hypothetical protein
MKAQRFDSEGRILLGDNTGNGMILLWPGSVKLDFNWTALYEVNTSVQVTIITLNSDLRPTFQNVKYCLTDSVYRHDSEPNCTHKHLRIKQRLMEAAKGV